jgi:hypothetical protein
MVQHPLTGQGFLILKFSRSRSDTPHSVGLLLTSDRPVADTSLPDTTQHFHETDIHSPVVFEPAITAKWPLKYTLDRAATEIG